MISNKEKEWCTTYNKKQDNFKRKHDHQKSKFSQENWGLKHGAHEGVQIEKQKPFERRIDAKNKIFLCEFKMKNKALNKKW